MLTGIRECQVAEIRSNLIRMIGSLALLLVSKLNDTTSNVICTITEFILDQAHKENEVWVLAEAVDTLVDLYAEDDTDVLAVKVKLVDKLKVLAPILKNKVNIVIYILIIYINYQLYKRNLFELVMNNKVLFIEISYFY